VYLRALDPARADRENREVVVTKSQRRHQNTKLMVAVAQEVAAAIYRVTVPEMLGRDRSRPPSAARSMAAWLLREYADMSFPEIGKAMGGRNHTSVMRAIRAIDDRKLNSGMFEFLVLQACQEFENRVALRKQAWSDPPKDTVLLRRISEGR
jgi:chromosomal replication initiator protein